MDTLVALWELSLVLCLLGAMALIALIVARALTARAERRRLAARKAVLPLLLGGGDPDGPVSRAQADVAMDLTIELAELMRGSDGDAMLRAAEALDVPRHLAQRLRSPAAQERLNAAETLALFGDHAHAAERALDDRDPAVRLGAALALAHRDEGPDPEEILRKLRAGVEEHSLMLVPLMRDFAARDAAVVVAIVHDQSMSDEARLSAIDALADLGPVHVPLIVAVWRAGGFAQHLEPRLIAALGRTRHPAALEPVRAALGSEVTRVRAAAAEAAGRAGLADLAPMLRVLLADGDWTVRIRAAEALIALGERGVEELSAAAASDSAVARHAASTILAERALS